MSRLRTALGEAMSHLETANVAAATAAVQRALGLKRYGVHTRPDPDSAVEAEVTAGIRSPHRRPLAEVVDALRGLRDRFTGPAPAATPAPEAEVDGAGRFTAHHFACDAGSLAYKLYLPGGSRGRRPALVMMLHGCTQGPDDFARGTQMNALADRHGLIVVYPQQSRSANGKGCWNWFDGRHQHRGAGEPAVLAGLAREIAGRHAIGRDHTFVAGLSAGGAMAEVLAATYPDVFAAAGIHSGLPYGAAVDVVSALSAMKGHALRTEPLAGEPGPAVRRIVFHGDADTTVHASNAQRILDRVTADAPTAGQEINESTINGRKVTRTTVGANGGVAQTEHWLIHGAGHAWSGAGHGGSYTDPQGPDASREMVRFFMQQ